MRFRVFIKLLAELRDLKKIKTKDQLKERIFDIIQPGVSRHKVLGKTFDVFIMTLIVLSITNTFILTCDLPKVWTCIIGPLEILINTVFMIEYILRVWTADLLFPNLTPIAARRRFIRSKLAIIDLISFLPYYLGLFFINISPSVIYFARVIRMLRVFKFSRYTSVFPVIWGVIKGKLMPILGTFSIIWILLLVSSMMIYYPEHQVQPEKFKNAFSGLWYAIMTLTTTGYGDLYPVTTIGKIFGAFIAILGVALVAIPTGILSSGFIDYFNKKHDKTLKKADQKQKSDEAGKDEDDEIKYCPHCGKRLR